MMGPTRCGSHALSALIDDCKSINRLKQIHAKIITTSSPLSDPTSLLLRLLFAVATAPAAASPAYAAAIFNQIHPPGLFSYNCVIRSHCREAAASPECLSLYKRMLQGNVRPNHLTFPFLLKACARRLDVFSGRCIQSHVVKLGFEADLFVQNVFISLFAECDVLGCALRVFDEMTKRDIVSWNSFIIGCLRCGKLDLALKLFRKMGERNLITWNSIITGFVQGGRPKAALSLFQEMQTCAGGGTLPDGVTLASVLSACATLGALDQGKWVHWYLKRRGLEFDVVISTALMDMYGKCGCVDQAVELFREMPKKDVLAWTAMIKVFAEHGLGEEALQLFEEMVAQGIRPNLVTFVALLCACAHAGLVEKAWGVFYLMRDLYGFEPQVQHYACMVDSLARTGCLMEAEELIRSMEAEPDVYVWGALLGGCRMHGNVEMGERVARHLIKLDPQNHAFYVALSDIYAKAGRFDDVKRVRSLMEEEGIRKTAPGCSMIEINGIVHEFSVQGSQENVMDEIKWVLHAANSEMKLLIWDIDFEVITASHLSAS